MIKLLLVTWNAVAHDKLDLDETEPQLAFVAYHMTTKGQQKITRDELERCVINARNALPELLGYTTVSPTTFIDQVEERSSLFIQLGFEENDEGSLVPSYEFSHLSFQEYLTAKAIAEGWLPDSDANALDVLLLHFSEDHWGEVTPLVAVLLGRKAKTLIEQMITLSYSERTEDDGLFNNLKKVYAPIHLANCIASEVPMSPDLLEKSITAVVLNKNSIESYYRENPKTTSNINVFETIYKSKYGSTYESTVRDTLFATQEDEIIYEFSKAWIDIYTEYKVDIFAPSAILQLLQGAARAEQVLGVLQMMNDAFNADNDTNRSVGISRKDTRDNSSSAIMEALFTEIIRMLQTDDCLFIYSAAWCLAWSGYNKADIIPDEFIIPAVMRLAGLWCSSTLPRRMKRMVSWGMSSVCKPGLSQEVFRDIVGLAEAIDSNYYSDDNEFDATAALYLAILTNHWSELEISEKSARTKRCGGVADHLGFCWNPVMEKTLLIGSGVKSA